MSTQSKKIEDDQTKDIPTIQKVIAILWPSFLVAGVSTGLIFAYVDPKILLSDTQLSQASRISVYTLTFFGSWLIGATSSLLTCYFRRHCHDCNTDKDKQVINTEHE